MSFPILLSLALLATGQSSTIPPGGRINVPLEGIGSRETYRVQVNLLGPILARDRFRVTLESPGGWRSSKMLHAGDPDLYLLFRPSIGGQATLAIESSPDSGSVSVRTNWTHLDLRSIDQPAIEAEPNDTWQQANPLQIGRTVYGSSDDVDYLENLDEGKAGLDWFRFEVLDDAPGLVYLQLELLDRDVSANLRVHRLDPVSGEVRPYETGKDPMEIVHDRERERYSTHLSRTLGRGTYFVEVNANHPDYILRTRSYPVPPLSDPSKAVESGLNYLLEAGDAWFAQVPREGNIFVRSANLHDTATRCTACHASSFPTEASLVGLANGYPIRAKQSMLYLMDRLANSPTPLYGDNGLYWQRFIAIPLQAQGKQGGIVLDFENQVLGRQTPEFARFGPFLQAAWRGRRSLPADEVNGVVPLDSKFGLAWRDWRVLNEMMKRTGRVAYAQAADAIADILDDPSTDRQVETLQDRIHRLYAWWLVDPVQFAGRIKGEAEALLTLQNPDGGWHELDRKPGPSAVYTTGQLTWTLLKLGYRRDDPRIKRALTYLLAQQQPFGGWFQTSTHENFRTPMRETRYAVEALAEAFPRSATPSQGWGNRDGKPSRLPREGGSIVALLDDLDNLWEVPAADRPGYSRAVARLLNHPEPLIKAQAAACLGRIGDRSAVEGLVDRLGDPSKVVWRSAAWALRRLANQGHGVEELKSALSSPDPATRRGAVRVFAYQFSGMDGRLDLADLLIERSSDPDLWTRLQAIRSLRQWFYRSNDIAFRRRVVDAYLARMAVPDEPVVRKALCEGMYILLDENLGGGVSLQKNLAALPEKFRKNALEGRKAVERDVLLGPILAALESGNVLQREALVRSFDGSFFKGRTYARQPSGMLDVGNDREFGFLFEPPLEVLDRTFAALLSSDLNPEVRRRAIQLASFFQVPARSSDSSIQIALLKGLDDPDPAVREAAKLSVGNDLELRGAEQDPRRLDSIRASLHGATEARKAVVRAIARNRALMATPEILSQLRSILLEADPRPLLPVLGQPDFSDAEVLAAIARSWPESSEVVDRLGLLDVLLSRPGLIDAGEPQPQASELLRLAVVDRSASVREKALGTIDRVRNRKLADRLLLAGLADDTPSLRRQALAQASSRESFWSKPEASERLLALLVDPATQVREQALATVERQGLARGVPAVARRVKALAGDPDLKARAEACLEMQGFKSDSVEPDVNLGRPRVLKLSTFRDKVNPVFYQAGEDGHSCARCHANHGVLRIGEADAVDSLAINYNSALKVINLGDPEASLLLRKPRSPHGQGAPDETSPTGLTHVGGPRWDGVDHPAYRAILDWIREASEDVGNDGPPDTVPRPEARP
jgi:HEAT repeat protein